MPTPRRKAELEASKQLNTFIERQQREIDNQRRFLPNFLQKTTPRKWLSANPTRERLLASVTGRAINQRIGQPNKSKEKDSK